MTREPAEHHRGQGRSLGEIQMGRCTVETSISKRGKTNGKRKTEVYQLFCFTLHYYLLEPEGEPAIIPEREEKREEEMRACLFMHSICLKTRLCLIHQTQVANRGVWEEKGLL